MYWGEAISCYYIFQVKDTKGFPGEPSRHRSVPQLIIAEDENAQKRREEPGSNAQRGALSLPTPQLIPGTHNESPF